MTDSPSQTSLIKELLMGFCLGTANIIPGVSGGTFLMIFQIYERVFDSVGNINAANARYLTQSLLRLFFRGGRQNTWQGLAAFLTEKDFLFIFKLVIGAIAAIICLSSLMKFLITSCFAVTYALFFGLIFVSIIIPVKMLTHRKTHLIFFAAIGAALTIYVTWAVNPYEKVARKSALYEQQYQEQAASVESTAPLGSDGILFQGRYTPAEYVYSFLCGSVAVSAMVLPGISGSLVLILMGEYFEVVSAISGLAELKIDYIAYLFFFGLGIIFGGLFFARLISAVLKRFYNETMAFLIGLMIGSLWALWPFKEAVTMPRQYIRSDAGIVMLENVKVYTNINIMPEMGLELYLSLLFFVIGGIIMSFFTQKEEKV